MQVLTCEMLTCGMHKKVPYWIFFTVDFFFTDSIWGALLIMQGSLENLIIQVYF